MSYISGNGTFKTKHKKLLIFQARTLKSLAKNFFFFKTLLNEFIYSSSELLQ